MNFLASRDFTNTKKFVLLILLVPLLSFLLPQKQIKILMAGDSTMSIKDPDTYPETGWGMPFEGFWNKDVEVINLAKNGRSTSSFRKEGLWNRLMEDCNAGDYVFIQFGHNDEVSTKKSYTTETDFKNNLIQYIKEARNKNAQPVLITPVARRKFNIDGKIVGTHEVYSGIVRAVAAEQKVPLIDLDKESQQLYQQMGVEGSALLFNHLKPGEHPNYPDGKTDDTHFNELGARKIAEIVLKDIRILLPDLAAYIYKPESK